MAKVAVLGYGTVGSGVVEVLEKNAEAIKLKAGQEVEVKSVLDLRDFEGDPIQEKIVHDIDLIVNDPEIDVVVEVMGGVDVPFKFVSKCLEAGKSVCTSNKALVEAKGPQLLALAKEKNVNFQFEASVGGGIPIIRPLNTSLTADKILKVTGIMNGTTNFILTKMSTEGASYEDVLKEAQELGYAERNPEADVKGHDACRKIAILTSLYSGKTVKYGNITCEGITEVSNEDFAYAKELGCVIKLLASSYEKDGKIYAITAPFMIDKNHPLYNVNGVLNGIYVNGNMVGDLMFFGSGAGKLPTAAAVCADVVDCVRNLDRALPVFWSEEELELGKTDDEVRAFFVRVKGTDITKAKEAFNDEINVIRVKGIDNEFAFFTEKMTEKEFNEAAAKLDVISRIRIDDTVLN